MDRSEESVKTVQASLQNAKDAWLKSVPDLDEQLALYGDGADLQDCLRLHDLFTRPGNAQELISQLVGPVSLCLRENPLGHVPFRHQYQPGLGVLQLGHANDAALSLVLYEETAFSRPLSACFTDSECAEIVLAGSGQALILTLLSNGENARIDRVIRPLNTGTVIRIDGAARTKLIDDISGRMVVLRLSRTPPHPMPSREYRLRDGKLLHCAAGGRNESRYDMMVALLGSMRRRAAAPIFDEMTREGSDHLRWQALRHCLTLDTARGFAALCALADGPADPLAEDASALRAQLLNRHPQLAALNRRMEA